MCNHHLESLKDSDPKNQNTWIGESISFSSSLDYVVPVLRKGWRTSDGMLGCWYERMVMVVIMWSGQAEESPDWLAMSASDVCGCGGKNVIVTCHLRARIWIACQGCWILFWRPDRVLTLLSIKNKHSWIFCLKCSFGLKAIWSFFFPLRALNACFKSAYYDSIFKEWSKWSFPVFYNRNVKYFWNSFNIIAAYKESS